MNPAWPLTAAKTSLKSVPESSQRVFILPTDSLFICMEAVMALEDGHSYFSLCQGEGVSVHRRGRLCHLSFHRRNHACTEAVPATRQSTNAAARELAPAPQTLAQERDV